jgi:hypothetical protein
VRGLVVALVVAFAAVGYSQPKPAEPSPRIPVQQRLPTEKAKPIDIKDAIDKLDVFRDDTGMYYVVPRIGSMDNDGINDWIFFGDGKTMYQQRVFGFGSEATRYDWTVWAPRVRGLVGARVGETANSLEVQCSSRNGKRNTVQLKADEAKMMLKDAKFYPPLWQRQSRTLARDDDANYYFVDQLRDDAGGNGYRVFAGPKGAMKELPLVNLADDSAGAIFATKGGDLKLIKGKDDAVWIKGDKRTALTVLDPSDNRYLIYRELGIYGTLGTVCDDQ